MQDVQVTHRGGFGGIEESIEEWPREKMHDDTALAPIGGSVCAAAAVFFCRAAFDCDAEACGTYGWGFPVIFVAAAATGVAILLLIIAAVGVLATARRHTVRYRLGVPLVVLLCVTFAKHADAAVLAWTEGAGGGTAWSARWKHAAVCFDDGVVVTTGGNPGGSEVHTTTAGGTALSSVSQTTFTARYGHAIARVPGNADAFLVVGGSDSGWKNDALLTEDRGVSFVEKSNSVFTSGRYGTALVATGPATFVAYGGSASGTYYNEVRQSTNSGVDWTTLRAEGGGGGECSGDAAMWSV